MLIQFRFQWLKTAGYTPVPYISHMRDLYGNLFRFGLIHYNCHRYHNYCHYIVCFPMFSHIIGEGYGIFPPTGTCLCTVSLLLFKVERDNAYSCSIFFMLGSICRYAIHHQKAASRFLRFRFWKAGKQVLSAQPDQFEPFLLLL